MADVLPEYTTKFGLAAAVISDLAPPGELEAAASLISGDERDVR